MLAGVIWGHVELCVNIAVFIISEQLCCLSGISDPHHNRQQQKQSAEQILIRFVSGDWSFQAINVTVMSLNVA